MIRFICCWAVTLLVVVGLGCNDSNADGTDSNGDSNVDSNINTDTSTGTGTGIGTDTVADTGIDTGTDTGADTGTDTGIDTGTESVIDTAPDTGTDTLTDTGVDTATDTATDTGTDSGISGSLVYAVNTGSGIGASLNGVDYRADRFSTGGSTQTVTNAISGVDEDALYQSERYGSYSYEVPVTNATYSVLLHFAELYHTEATARSFTVEVEGQEVATNLDIFTEVGQFAAHDLVALNIPVSDQSLTITLTSITDNATISGFALYSGDGGEFREPPEPVDGDITVDIETSYQIIDGFGGALPMWGSGTLSNIDTQKLVGMGDTELGLSIVRTIIRPYERDWGTHVSALQTALSYGSEVKVMASPWTPPSEWKDNNSLIDGGKLLTSHYGDYANHLNRYVSYMNDQGVEIYVTSLQNEPNWHPSYESCDWSGNEFVNFLVEHGDSIQNTKLTVAETIGFQTNYTDPVLNNPDAASKIDIISGHLYGPWNTSTNAPNASMRRYDLAEQRGKHVWMTEWNLHEADDVNGSDPPDGHSNRGIWADPANLMAWDETLDDVMASVHYSMEVNWNAYIWWWARRFYSFIGEARDNGYGTPAGEILKRGWAFSQYSKYVRPGYVRVNVTQNSTVGNNVLITAYRGGNNKIVLVIINKDNSAKNGVSIGLPVVPSAAAYTFTSQHSARTEGDISISGQLATINIPARSISTVVIDY